ncbi:exopolysaccharide Pel transporter PelG [Paenibacillus sp. GYB003]|uniref:exopolysaccharide Pel transporter PelG n=1 Tax=Paenibacillus sp. GYB003 TaxID=2994392 RepID=UPI002F96D0D4
MAGIGFELKKLFRDRGLLSHMKAYGYSSMTTVGPMVLCVSMIVAMQWLMTAKGAPFLERELFMATVVYCFIFSVLLTGGVSMLLTRFTADMMYQKKHEYLLSSFYGAAAVCLPIGALCAVLFLSRVPAGPGYKLATFVFFSELIVIWLQSVFLSALKDYKRIARNFLYGVAIAVVGSWLLLSFTKQANATAVLTMIDAGFFVVALLSGRHLEKAMPPRSSRLYFSFLAYFRKYPALFWIGTFFYAGVYVHSFVYWSGPSGVRVAEAYVISPFYDTPVFYAYLTVVPTLVTFVVSMETAFYEKYREYYALILNGGTYQEIARAKQTMQHTLMQQISFVMEVQLIATVVSIALGIKLLPAIAFSMEQIDTFIILVLGYYLFINAFIVMLLMLYFDDRKGALAISGLFVLLNASLSYWTMQTESHGLGMVLASFGALALALTRLVTYVRNIDYYTYCDQPLGLSAGESGPSFKLPFRGRKGGKTAATAAMLLVLAGLLSACSDEDPQAQPPADAPPVVQEASSTASERFVEDKRLYERDDDTSVLGLYLTILPGQTDEKQPLDWYRLNRLQEWMEEGDLKIIMQEGPADGSGVAPGTFGYGTTEANAKISLRGNTARYAPQRSYKIRLNEQAGLWRDQRVLNLNKHYFDASRVRNKLSYDLFETLPDIASLRTQFVRLFVKDLSAGGGGNQPFVDYGLYTHIENPNKQFLKNHWLDPNGQLYKAEMFEFFRYPESLKSQSDPGYDKQAFERVLEIQGREDHDKLLAMLDDVNNRAIPINDVIAEHFDLDNYLTWLAANILMDNMDTDAHNYLLYSPLNSNKWYFVPWDYDGGWELQRGLSSISPYSSGISNYWGNVLHNRFLHSEANVRLLRNKIDELHKTINNESVAKRLAAYKPVLEQFLTRAPDKNFWTIQKNKLDDELKVIAETPSRSIARFEEDLQKPKPIFLGDVRKNEKGQHVFTWDHSFDLQGDELFYDWSIAKDPLFTSGVENRNGLTSTQTLVDGLKPGTYYWKVVVRDQKGNSQISFDHYEDEEENHYFGIRQIKVE